MRRGPNPNRFQPVQSNPEKPPQQQQSQQQEPEPEKESEYYEYGPGIEVVIDLQEDETNDETVLLDKAYSFENQLSAPFSEINIEIDGKRIIFTVQINEDAKKIVELWNKSNKPL